MKKEIIRSVWTDGVPYYLTCYVPFHVKENGTPTVFIHPGGTCLADDYGWIAGPMCRRGYLVYCLHQRGYGSGEPGINDYGGYGQQRDLLEAIQFVKRQKYVDLDRFIGIGHSSGAHMIQRLAVDEDFTCCIALSQESDWIEYTKSCKYFLKDYYQKAMQRYGGDPDEHPDEYLLRSCIQLADKIKVPVLAITGSMDNITPPQQAREMTKALNDAGNIRSEFVLIEGAGHFFEKFGFSGEYRSDVAEIIMSWIDTIFEDKVISCYENAK